MAARRIVPDSGPLSPAKARTRSSPLLVPLDGLSVRAQHAVRELIKQLREEQAPASPLRLVKPMRARVWFALVSLWW